MRLTETSLAPRPVMEAIDLGVVLARRHRHLLTSSGAIVTLPVFAVLILLLHDRAADWPGHLGNALYVLVLVVWEPVYVACGFTLCLNRRTVLEAWDVERVFRRLRQRLTGSAYALLIGAALVLTSAGSPASAQTQDFLCPAPEASPSPADPLSAAPDKPRLMQQALSSQAARQSIKDVLQQPPFTNLKPVSGWRLAKEASEARRSATGNPDGAFIEWLERLANSTLALARVLEILLWAVVMALSALVIWRYRAWFAAFVSPRTPHPAAPLHEVPSQLFGLQVSAETLPDDIAGSAERLWATQPGEALGLLYRALLSRLLTEHRLPVTSADTEGEILARIAGLGRPALDRFSRTLILHWQNLAYGHRPPPASARIELCDGWRQLFNDEATR